MGFKIAIVVFAVFQFTSSPCAAQQEDYQQLSLGQHIEYRSMHGSQSLRIDATLTNLAQGCAADYASRNTIDHRCARELGKGENLYMYSTSGDALDVKDVIARAMQKWYDENQGYNYNDPGNSAGAFGHFTQLVWDGSTSMGCGVSTLGENSVACCLYDPPGNTKDYDGGYSFYVQNVRAPM